MGKRVHLQIGSLRGGPQASPTGAFGDPGPGRKTSTAIGGNLGAVAPSGTSPLARRMPPSRRGKGCCRSGCAGCPWAEAMRRRIQQRRQATTGTTDGSSGASSGTG